MSGRKEAVHLKRRYEQAGFRVEQGKHHKVYDNDGALRAVFAVTPSDTWGVHNARRELERLTGQRPSRYPELPAAAEQAQTDQEADSTPVRLRRDARRAMAAEITAREADVLARAGSAEHKPIKRIAVRPEPQQVTSREKRPRWRMPDWIPAPVAFTWPGTQAMITGSRCFGCGDETNLGIGAAGRYNYVVAGVMVAMDLSKHQAIDLYARLIGPRAVADGGIQIAVLRLCKECSDDLHNMGPISDVWCYTEDDLARAIDVPAGGACVRLSALTERLRPRD